MLSFNEIYNLYKRGSWETAGDDVQYKFYLDNKDKKIYVVYQCSTSDRDWVNNFRFFTKSIYVDSRKIECHVGFLSAFLSAKDKVFQQLESYMVGHPDYKVVMTGHSFGGAMSMLSAMFFYREFNKKANMVTFGSPKVIRFKKDLKFVKETCLDNYYNWGNYNDMVTYMPPHYTRLGHNRIGEKFNLGKILFHSDHYHTNYDELEYPKIEF